MNLFGKLHLLTLILLPLLTSCVSMNQKPTTWKDYIDSTKVEQPLDLYYETHGKGSPVILLHGLGGTLYTWRHLVEPLSSNYHLILFDLKGAGQSPKPYDDKYSMFDQAELIYQFILQKDLGNLTLIGHSFGGSVAMLVALKLAKQAPQRLSRLIVIDTVSYPQKLPFVVRMLRMPLLGPLGLYLIPDRIKVHRMLKTIYFDDDKIAPEDVEAYAAPLGLPGAKYALRKTAKQIIPDNIDELIGRYSEITVPTLIIWGREDEIIPLENGIRLHRAIRNSQLVIIDRCGHDPPEECPKEVLEVIQRFLGNKRSLGLVSGKTARDAKAVAGLDCCTEKIPN
jgi:pimeloyl-ACP methyl ester carboxylesterase